MEFGIEYEFTDAKQFWSELHDLLACPPMSSLDELDSSLRSYIALASQYMDDYLSSPAELDQAFTSLLEAPFFTAHLDRMMANIISTISLAANSSSLFISLMLVLHLGLTDPLSASYTIIHSDPTRSGSSKVFRVMRKRWNDVVPVLMKWVWDAGVVESDHTIRMSANGNPEHGATPRQMSMPAEGWEERVGTAATTVLYEVCRVQRLNSAELAIFSYEFIEHLFHLVERTRDVEDETFNYTLIKLIIALNEQFMVSSLRPSGQLDGGNGSLPAPILPKIVGERKAERGMNLVLEVLKSKEGESKTFGENIIFILNRSNGTPDSLCVSLLILKILYLLFTTPDTQEYFYTNDLCVLVDVFIRELCDLGEESEGLKHTYLRVLHPLLTNTQLRQHDYKRPQLQRVLQSLISPSSYREPDPTTRRLVERNLRAGWCEGLPGYIRKGSESRRTRISSEGTPFPSSEPTSLWLDAVRGCDTNLKEANGSSLSVDAIANAEDLRPLRSGRRHLVKRGSSEWSATSIESSALSSPEAHSPSLSNSVTLEPVHEHSAPQFDSKRIASLTAQDTVSTVRSVTSSRSSSQEGIVGSSTRRRRPPPPPTDLAATSPTVQPEASSPVPIHRRAAPGPPVGKDRQRSNTGSTRSKHGSKTGSSDREDDLYKHVANLRVADY